MPDAHPPPLFLAAVALYVLLGSVRRSFNYSTTRLVMGVVAALVLMTIAAAISPDICPLQVLLWGGNVAYLGAIVGWMVSDAFRG